MNKNVALRVAIGIALIATGIILFVVSRNALPTAQTHYPSVVSGFVTVNNDKFKLNGRTYYFVGANFWQGMELGVDGATGNRKLLVRELDHLQQLGVTNLRIMASSEGPNTEPHRITPALMTSPGVYDRTVLDGLDFLLSEMGKRGMKAVMTLNNFWYWSGGMSQYVSWQNGTSIPYPGDWNAFEDYAAEFYSCGQCQTWYRNYINMIINHVNQYSGIRYRDDPTIFSWELANEPRRHPEEWIDDTAAYIKSLDPNHLVTTGSEGNPPGETMDFKKTHDGPNIDYATIHIWPQNWGWYDPMQPSSYEAAEGKARDYFEQHAAEAAALGKPLVLEEFGLARDRDPLHDIYNPLSPTDYRDRFYTAMYAEVYTSMIKGGPAAGDSFWAWAGESRPGDKWVGDPPHETPGWYSVYNTDKSTLAIISGHAQKMLQAAIPALSMGFPFTQQYMNSAILH
jgi:mannan endo-1,4-beta-mannosidase